MTLPSKCVRGRNGKARVERRAKGKAEAEEGAPASEELGSLRVDSARISKCYLIIQAKSGRASASPRASTSTGGARGRLLSPFVEGSGRSV